MDHAAAPPPALRAAAAAHLPAPQAPWRPLRGGRVNRLWRVGGAVVKQFDPAGDSPLFPNSAADEAAALRFAAPQGLAPALRAAGPDWVIRSHAPGRPWRSDPGLAARLLARLHALPPPASFAPRPGGSAAILAQAAAIGAPWPAPADPGIGPPARPAPLHGDPVPGNILVHRGSALLIDWQCPAAGDPAEDIALFLSPAMQWLYRGAPLSADDTAAFLAAYGDAAAVARYRALAPLLHWRIAAHCAWRARRGDAGYARALRLEQALAPGR
jgi:aminoglycoside phosphotransferase (APT) family kinase protein